MNKRYLDVLAAIKWMREYIEREATHLDKERIGVYGESMGAASVLIAAASDKNLYPSFYYSLSILLFYSFFLYISGVSFFFIIALVSPASFLLSFVFSPYIIFHS